MTSDCGDVSIHVRDRSATPLRRLPRFARGRRELRGALRGYRGLFSRALRMVEPDGVFAAASCTGVVSDADFDRVLRDAADDVRLQILRRCGQPPDHPYLTSVPEGG